MFWCSEIYIKYFIPAKDGQRFRFFQLTIESVKPNHHSIEITSLNGQQILSGEMEGTSHQIDLSSFQKGIYFITIRSKDFVTTRKIVKL